MGVGVAVRPAVRPAVRVFGGAAPAFHPRDLPGLQQLLTRQTGFYSAASGGVLVTADGANVLRWEDAEGAAPPTTPSGTAPTLATAGGVRVLNFAGAVRTFGRNVSGTRAGFTVHMLMRRTPTYARGRMGTLAADRGTSLFFTDEFNQRSYNWQGVTTAFNADIAPVCGNDGGQASGIAGWHLHTFVYDGAAGVRTYIDGIPVGQASVTSGLTPPHEGFELVAPQRPSPSTFSQGGLWIGGDSSSSCAGQIAFVAAYTEAHTGAQVSQLYDWVEALYPELYYTGGHYGVFIGASMLNGIGSSDSVNDPVTRVAGVASDLDRWYAAAIGGARTWQLSATGANGRWDASIRLMVQRAKRLAGPSHKCVVVMCEGRSSMATDGRTPEQAIAELEALAALARAAGADRVVSHNCLSRAALSSATVDAFNALHASSTAWDEVADWYGQPNIGGAAANTNTTYFSSDAIHFKTPGSIIAAGETANAINRALAE